MIKVVVFSPKSEFTTNQCRALASLGRVVYSGNRKELPLKNLFSLAAGAKILAADPDNFGGFEKAKERVTKVMETLPNLKGLSLSTTSCGWVDLDYCQKRNIPVSNVPGYSRESVAEHTIALLLGLAKRIFVSDRQTQKGQYKLKMGFELKGKTLGIIGLGNIGSRVAELAQGIGMKVIAYNRSPRSQPGVEMKSLAEVLKKSDAISLHLTDCPETKNIINQKALVKMKKGVIIVNTADRSIVDEEALAEAIRAGRVYAYAYEGEDLDHGPLAGLENAVGFQGFGWYTREALNNLFQIWTDNIIALAKGHPENRVPQEEHK